MNIQTGYRELLRRSGDHETKGRRPARRFAAYRSRVRSAFRGLGGSPARNTVLTAALIAAGGISFMDRVSEPVADAAAAQASERTVLYSPWMRINGETLSEALLRSERERTVAEKVERYRAYRLSPELAGTIYDSAVTNGIDPDVAFGLVRAESSFRNAATSHVGAVGLAQLMPRTARWMAPGTTIRDLRNPQKNLDIGFQYLQYLMEKYDGNMDLALLAYNRGPGTVDRILRRGGNPHNGYVEMVLAR